MKTLRVFFALQFIVLMGIASAGWAEKVASIPPPAGYVDDYAGVISVPAKAELEAACRELHEKTRAQVFLVTVKTLDGEPVERFANELFAKWKIGEKKTDRGVLLLLATNDHKRWIEVGYGFEGILNDAKAGDIGREMIPALEASNFDEAARLGVRSVSQVIGADAGVAIRDVQEDQGGKKTSAGEANAAAGAPAGIGELSSVPVWPLVVLPGFFIFVFGLTLWGAAKNRRRGIAGETSFPGGFDSQGWAESGSGSGFGGDAGGGGDSFGGGDGGSSGGGGAGGDW